MIGQLSLAFQADDFLVLDVLPRLENVTLALIEMKTSPGKFVSSLTTGHSIRISPCVVRWPQISTNYIWIC